MDAAALNACGADKKVFLLRGLAAFFFRKRSS
jgi:hypothetical protein